MGYEPHLITPFVESGLKKYYKPFIIGETAFPDISDAYPWRGSVRKREGYRLLASFPNGDFPVQGLRTFINPSTLNNALIGFSLTKSYNFNGSIFVDITQLSDASTPFLFGTGLINNFSYYWTSNFAGSMWMANGLGLITANVLTAANGIFYLTAAAPNSWNIHQPLVSGTTIFLNGALIIIPYKGRLVALSPILGDVTGGTNANIRNRATWCQLGTPYVATGGGHATHPPSAFSTDINSWRTDIPGKGGFIDADTSEQIVSAEIVKDTLIVFFQRSTWRLRYTGNEILPFIWERLNTQYGAESTFSNVAFDEAALAFSRFGWIASDTNDVARIDLDIPDDSFSVEGEDSSFDGLSQVQGIRDYYRNFAYWTFPPISEDEATKIYAYNYIDKSWSIFNPSDPIGVFGNFYNTTDITWSSLSNIDDNKWSDYNGAEEDDTWSSFGSAQNLGFPYIVGGDSLGNVFLMFEFNSGSNQDEVEPGNVETNFNFSISTKNFNPYIDQGAKCRLGYVDLYCSTNTGGEITVNHFLDNHAAPAFSRAIATYPRGTNPITAITTGATTAITVSQLHNLTTNQNVIISDVNGTIGNLLNNKTVPVTITSTTSFTVPIDTIGFTWSVGGLIWSPGFNPGDVTYTRVYLGATAHMHQLEFTLSDAQLADPIKGKAQFEIQALVLWTKQMGRIRG